MDEPRLQNKFYTEEEQKKIDVCLTCTLPAEACDNPRKSGCPFIKEYGAQRFTARIQHTCGKEEDNGRLDIRPMRQAVNKLEKNMFPERVRRLWKVLSITGEDHE